MPCLHLARPSNLASQHVVMMINNLFRRSILSSAPRYVQKQQSNLKLISNLHHCRVCSAVHNEELKPNYKTQKCKNTFCKQPWRCHFYHSDADRRCPMKRKTVYCPVWKVRLVSWNAFWILSLLIVNWEVWTKIWWTSRCCSAASFSRLATIYTEKGCVLFSVEGET